MSTPKPKPSPDDRPLTRAEFDAIRRKAEAESREQILKLRQTYAEHIAQERRGWK